MKTALITGSARGIGRACALRLARDGWRLALHYHKSAEAAAALRDELRAHGCDAEIFPADVALRGDVFALRDAVARFGRPSLLVCNAGIAEQRLFTDISEAQWQQMLAVNLSGVFYCCQAFLPDMIARKAGAIVTVSSIWGLQGASCEVHYSAAKAGVIGLTRALAQEVGPSGVTVNCVAPGVILTEMNRELDEETLSGLAEEAPLSRNGQPEEVADAIYYLASEEASFITGQVVGVNGGMVI